MALSLEPKWVLLRRATASGLGRGSHTHKNNPGARPRPHGQLMGDDTGPPASVAPQNAAVLPSCPSACSTGSGRLFFFCMIFFPFFWLHRPCVPGPLDLTTGDQGLAHGPHHEPICPPAGPPSPRLCLFLCRGVAYGNLSKAAGEVVLDGVLCTSLVTDLAKSIAGHRAGVWAVCGHDRGSGLLRGRRLVRGTVPMGTA